MPLARIRGQLFDALVGPRDRRGVRVFVLHPPSWNQCTTVGGRHGVKRTPSVQEDPYMARYISLVRALPKVSLPDDAGDAKQYRGLRGPALSHRRR